MKKILVIHNRYKNIGGEDIAIKAEIQFLKKYYEVEILYYDNSITSIFNDFIYPAPVILLSIGNNLSNKLLRDL